MIGKELERGISVKRLCGSCHKVKPVEVVFESAGTSVNTLKELADWIEKHGKEYMMGGVSSLIKDK